VATAHDVNAERDVVLAVLAGGAEVVTKGMFGPTKGSNFERSYPRSPI
jgi:hypothetical protein